VFSWYLYSEDLDLDKKCNLLYKPEYKVTPYFYNEKIKGEILSRLTILNMSLSSDSCKQKEVKTILLRNIKLKIKYLNYNSRYFQKHH
jgi:hypothetical protein